MHFEKYGPWALIVGGSEGIGASYARKLAAMGFSLVLVARKTGPLEELANELRAGGTVVRALSVDMSEPGALEKVRVGTDDVEIGFLIYNAGCNNVRGNFIELDPAVYRSVIAINVIGPTEFVRHYGPMMQKRGRGGIILSSSGAAFLGAPGLSTYCGSKAFSRMWGEGLWAECAPMGIDVLNLVINFTATPAMARLGYDLAKAQSPDDVADEALAAIGQGPLLILGGEPARDLMSRRSALDDRGALIRSLATPPRGQSLPQSALKAG